MNLNWIVNRSLPAVGFYLVGSRRSSGRAPDHSLFMSPFSGRFADDSAGTDVWLLGCAKEKVGIILCQNYSVLCFVKGSFVSVLSRPGQISSTFVNTRVSPFCFQVYFPGPSATQA